MKVAKHNTKIRSVAVLTSGGDAPGMNAAIRAVVRYSISRGLQVYGVETGYSGLVDARFQRMELASVANIIQRGGTILKTDRCPDFHKKSVRKHAAERMRDHGIDSLVVIGGDGSFRGAHLLWEEHQIPVMGIPGTIDNDLYGTELTIGFDTAVNTGIEAIDKIRDTASAHQRTFIMEVMGRNSGYIALDVGVGGGAEAIIIPEVPVTPKQVAAAIDRGVRRGKTSSIIVVAEGIKPNKSIELAKELKAKHGISSKVCILGHIQRGGSPSAKDRLIASLMGMEAVKSLLAGNTDAMIGVQGDKEVLVPFALATTKKKALRHEFIELARALAI